MIRKLLELSTSHLPPDVGRLGLDAVPGVIAYPIPHGWLMWIPSDPDDWALVKAPPAEVINIQRFARRHDCDFIRFDADGDTTDGLPTWSW